MGSVTLVPGCGAGGQGGGIRAVLEVEEGVCLLRNLVRNPSSVLGLGWYSGSLTVDSEREGRGERGGRRGREEVSRQGRVNMKR